MKKTMLALMATVGLAFGAKADVLNSTGFEGYSGDFDYSFNDSGEAATPYYWAVTNSSADISQTVLTAYGESATPEYVPDAFKNAANSTYLKVDTGADVLYRSVGTLESVAALNAGTPIPDGGLYFDANVQFTASDGDPTYDSENDKLVVWLKATEGETPTTNLVVTAATSINAAGEPQNVGNYEVSNITVDADKWYRLTVKALLDDDKKPYFNVYIDDVLVEADETSNFYSMVNPNTTEGRKITAVGFQGTGAVDNLVWTTDDPFPAPVVDTVALKIDLTDEAYMLADLTANAEPVDVAEPDPIVATVDDVITFVAKVYDGYTPTVEGYVAEKSAEPITIEDPDDGYAYTFTVTVTQAMIDNGLTLTINVTEDGEPTPSEDEKEIGPDGKGSISDETGNTYTKEEVEAMVTVVAPNAASLSDDAKAAFDAYFTKEAAYNSDTKKWEVTVTLDKGELEEDVDDAVEAALEAVVSNAETKNVAIPAGFYYKIEHGATVGLTGEPLTGTSTGSVAMPALGENAGFFKVSVDTTSFGE